MRGVDVALVVTRYVRVLHRARKERTESTRSRSAHSPSASAWSDDEDDDAVHIMKHSQRSSYDPPVQQTATHFPLAPQFMEEKVPLV